MRVLNRFGGWSICWCFRECWDEDEDENENRDTRVGIWYCKLFLLPWYVLSFDTLELAIASGSFWKSFLCSWYGSRNYIFLPKRLKKRFKSLGLTSMTLDFIWIVLPNSSTVPSQLPEWLFNKFNNPFQLIHLSVLVHYDDRSCGSMLSQHHP